MAPHRNPQRTVDRTDLGAWVLKCNPAVWDLRSLLDTGARRLGSWAVHPSYRTDLMAPGDRVLFWVSGPGHDGLTRGIWGLGHLLDAAEAWVETSQGHWRTASGAHAVRVRVRLDVVLLDEPLPDTALRAAGTDDLEVQRQPFMANPSFVTRAQLAGLAALLPAWPPVPDEVAS